MGFFRFRSPLLTESISLSFPPLTEMFHFSGCRVHNPMDSGYDDGPCRPSGYPIRIPPGLSSLAALRGFSQLAASFFACRHQGIHHKPFGSSFEAPGDSLLKSFFRDFLSVNPLCMLDSCVSLFLEIVYFPQNCWSCNELCCSLHTFILPRGCQSAALRPVCVFSLRGFYG